MSRICRTCLQKTNTAFKTSQVLGDFGEGAVRISVVLRYCIPELYLGLSLNPEICLTCKENLKVAYLFKKRCLNTENLIGNFLKNARCTGQCVELHDVLAFANSRVEQTRLDRDVSDDVSLKKLLESPAVSTEKSQVVGVNPSASNPINQGSIISLNNGASFIIQPGFLSQIVDVFGQPVNNQSQSVAVLKGIDNTNIMPPTQNVDDPNNLFKISNIFSVETNQETVKNDFDSTNTDITEHSITHEELDIKEEPLDMEPNSADPNSPSDEETLDASETASYPGSRAEGFLEDVPEVNYQDQYVDVPDFVTINNFGFKELEELRQQQQMEKKELDEEPSTPDLIARSNIDNNVAEETIIDENVADEVPNKLYRVLYADGKQMVTSANGYRQALDESTVEQDKNLASLIIQVPKNRRPLPVKKRRRRQIRIVPVDEQPASKKIKIAPKPNDNEVVVLFTSYTMDCMYINDHDYLISPYKRNKILFEEDVASCDGRRWMCVCYICDTTHIVSDHVKHMSTHGSKCKMCSVELGTPYMHNIHLKAHKKSCRYCTQILPYSQFKSHEAKHITEEAKLLGESAHTGKRRRRKKPNKDEKINSHGKELLALALKNNKESSQPADIDALKVALDNDLLFLQSSDNSADSTNLETVASLDEVVSKPQNSTTEKFTVETAIELIPSYPSSSVILDVLPPQSVSIDISSDSESDHSPEESNSDTDEDMDNSFEKNRKLTRKDSSETSNAAEVVKTRNKILDIDEKHREENNSENEVGEKAKRKLVEKRALRDNPCKKGSCLNQCNSFTEEDRREIFEFYWNLADSNKQKLFLWECMSICPVKRRRESKGIKPKKSTNEYYFRKDNERKRVCRQFFVNTLDITIRLLRTVADYKNLNKSPVISNKTNEQLARFKAFVDSLPVIPSKGSSTKKYLSSEIGSFNNLYRLYLRQMKKDSFTALKRSKFLALLKTDYNIGIQVPKKDKCSKCERFRNMPIERVTEREIKKYEDHIASNDVSEKCFLHEQE